MWYCPYCSTAVAVASASCPACGREISRTPAAKAPIAAVAPPEPEPAPVIAAPTSDMQRELEELLDANRVIEAIKIYRERMNVGLKEAKDAIDEMRASR